MPTHFTEQTAIRLKHEGIVAIIRGQFSTERILEIGRALMTARVPVMEVTLNTSNALGAIKELRARFGADLMVGAGTVRTVDQVDLALNAGAQFIVSPNFDPDSVAYSQRRDVLHIPGVFTATEAQNAFVAGCRMLKLFPSEVLGPKYLKALRAPLNDVDFMPTGGISVDNLADYVRAGAVAVGIGSELIRGPQQSIDEITLRAAALRKAWEQAKAKEEG